ncbi:MAG TPA: vWA domain-containing protein [Polyangiales bacterium]|nr:vWA domain-containing protein [Polyangiales bacterium]
MLGVGIALGLGACSDSKSGHGKDGGDGEDGGNAKRDGAIGDAAADGSDLQTLVNGLPSCGNSELTATPRDANVLLVIDESGSMTDQPSGFDTNKWDALKGALESAVAAVEDDVAFGLELFPHSASSTPIPLACTDNCCEMPAAPGIMVQAAKGAASAIKKELEGTSPAGGTPTALALSRAYEYFTSGAGKSLKGDKYVLLATDGGPNCNDKLTCSAKTCTTNLDGDCSISGGNCCDPMFGGSIAKARCLDDDATLAAIQKLAAAKIDTFVVGIPGSETYADQLDAFADAGGRAAASGTHKYYAVSASGGAKELTSTLELITKNVITSCDLQLASTPPNPNELNVYVDNKLVKQAGADGWKLDTKEMPPSIVLQGATCERVQSMGAKSVRVVYGCPTVQ